MLWLIRPVMIMFSLFAARTQVMMGWEHFTYLNSITYFMSSLSSFGIILATTFLCFLAFFALAITPVCLFAFIALTVSFLFLLVFCGLFIPFLTLFAFFGLIILLLAVFTIRPQTIIPRTVFVKFRNWKNLFAFRTSFCYDCFRHFRFLYKRFCLELRASTILALNSPIIKTAFCSVKGNI